MLSTGFAWCVRGEVPSAGGLLPRPNHPLQRPWSQPSVIRDRESATPLRRRFGVRQEGISLPAIYREQLSDPKDLCIALLGPKGGGPAC
jgi:hypothetical protein